MLTLCERGHQFGFEFGVLAKAFEQALLIGLQPREQRLGTAQPHEEEQQKAQQGHFSEGKEGYCPEG